MLRFGCCLVMALGCGTLALQAEEPRAPATEQYVDPYAEFGYKLTHSDQERLRMVIRDFRHTDHAVCGRELRQHTPEVNALIAGSYLDPIDIQIKIDLWAEVAGPKNPDAAVGLFDTYRALTNLAKPVLVPYVKDAGAAVVHRTIPDSDAETNKKSFSSRDLRDMIETTEGLIARCPSAAAAIFLMKIYADRYSEAEAPMRDAKRDRHRLVEACGGNPDKFDEDKPRTWTSILTARQRATIVEKLIPYIEHKNDSRRQIARNGLMVCVPPRSHPAWDAGRYEWDRWWASYKEKMLAGNETND